MRQVSSIKVKASHLKYSIELVSMWCNYFFAASLYLSVAECHCQPVYPQVNRTSDSHEQVLSAPCLPVGVIKDVFDLEQLSRILHEAQVRPAPLLEAEVA